MGASVSGQSVALALIMAAGMGLAWWWRQRVVRAKPTETIEASWEHVKREYPLSLELVEPPRLSAETATAVVRANPFSPERFRAPGPASGGEGDPGGSGGAPVIAPPRFVYKGRVNFGKSQRAIVEETTSRKTHFLEVGQEVTGFKVLDISETRVLLSNLKTREEVVVSLTATGPSSPKRGAAP